VVARETPPALREERPERVREATAPACTWKISWRPAARGTSRICATPFSNAHFSAGLCNLANIGYRTGHKLNLGPGPRFTGDAEADKQLTRQAYRKPFVV
jgi:hypothetical protein